VKTNKQTEYLHLRALFASPVLPSLVFAGYFTSFRKVAAPFLVQIMPEDLARKVVNFLWLAAPLFWVIFYFVALFAAMVSGALLIPKLPKVFIPLGRISRSRGRRIAMILLAVVLTTVTQFNPWVVFSMLAVLTHGEYVSRLPSQLSAEAQEHVLLSRR